MLHQFPPVNITTFHNFIVSLILVMCIPLYSTEIHSAEGSDNQILSIVSKTVDQGEEIRIKGQAPLVSTVYELPNPSRIIVDIAEAKPAPNIEQKIENSHLKVTINQLPDVHPPITRIEFPFTKIQHYSTRQEGSEIVVSINPTDEIRASTPTDSNTNAKDTQNTAANIKDVKITTKNNKTNIEIISDNPIVNFTNDTISKNGSENPKIIIDLKDCSIQDSLLKDQIINNSSVSKIQIARRASGIRFTLHSASENIFSFKISQIQNGLSVLIDDTGKDQLSKLINQKKNIEGHLPEINPLDSKLSPQAKEQQMQDAFNFSGYNKERITVEFQKMDLHNVFNFLRQVSGVNIVVDESVQGSLTLVLDDVPWDFALDIILNLKDLEKEERFNTLVIYPKGKGFQWPEEAQNNLSFQADSTVIEQESLVVQQQEKQSIEVIEAKSFIVQGRESEKRDDFETAAKFYEKAFDKWPSNTRLANKLSSLYLVKLRQNAKALYFSNRVLQIEKNNETALLNAAIASANMQDIQQAELHFKQAAQTSRPSKEVLLSYAAFNEERQKYNEAIGLLEKSDTLHGACLDSMVASARIYDKMGKYNKATERYQTILTSGFRIPPDLSKYISGRVTHKSSL